MPIRSQMLFWMQLLAKINARVAAETLVTTGLVLVAGEITTDCYVDIPRLVRSTIEEIGYTRAKYGFDSETCAVITSLDEQSPDIAMGSMKPWSPKQVPMILLKRLERVTKG